VGPLADGRHVFEVTATDGAGNTGRASHAWTVDTMAPAVTIDAAPEDPSNEASPTFAFSTEPGARVDGSAHEVLGTVVEGMSVLDSLYSDHVGIQRERTDSALAACGYESLALYAGAPHMQFLDDQPYPFKANPHFKLWAPLANPTDCWILYRPQQSLQLLFVQPIDYWHKPPSIPSDYWTPQSTPPQARQTETQRILLRRVRLERRAMRGECVEHHVERREMVGHVDVGIPRRADAVVLGALMAMPGVPALSADAFDQPAGQRLGTFDVDQLVLERRRT
jgi:hypothetical protein